MDVNGSLVPRVAVIKSWGIITNQVFKIRASYMPDTLLTAPKQSLTLLDPTLQLYLSACSDLVI